MGREDWVRETLDGGRRRCAFVEKVYLFIIIIVVQVHCVCFGVEVPELSSKCPAVQRRHQTREKRREANKMESFLSLAFLPVICNPLLLLSFFSPVGCCFFHFFFVLFCVNV